MTPTVNYDLQGLCDSRSKQNAVMRVAAWTLRSLWQRDIIFTKYKHTNSQEAGGEGGRKWTDGAITSTMIPHIYKAASFVTRSPLQLRTTVSLCMLLTTISEKHCDQKARD